LTLQYLHVLQSEPCYLYKGCPVMSCSQCTVSNLCMELHSWIAYRSLLSIIASVTPVGWATHSKYRPQTDTPSPPFSRDLLRGSLSDVRRGLYVCCGDSSVLLLALFQKSFMITINWSPCVVKFTEMPFW
jgi:hypothetical protein